MNDLFSKTEPKVEKNNSTRKIFNQQFIEYLLKVLKKDGWTAFRKAIEERKRKAQQLGIKV